eukprot:3652114-Prymnesium_polylepis.1
MQPSPRGSLPGKVPTSARSWAGVACGSSDGGRKYRVRCTSRMNLSNSEAALRRGEAWLGSPSTVSRLRATLTFPL